MKLGENLTKIMQDHDISISAISDITGFSRSIISYWMHGKYIPGSYELYKLSKVLKVTMDEIYGEGR